MLPGRAQVSTIRMWRTSLVGVVFGAVAPMVWTRRGVQEREIEVGNQTVMDGRSCREPIGSQQTPARRELDTRWHFSGAAPAVFGRKPRRVSSSRPSVIHILPPTFTPETSRVMGWPNAPPTRRAGQTVSGHRAPQGPPGPPQRHRRRRPPGRSRSAPAGAVRDAFRCRHARGQGAGGRALRPGRRGHRTRRGSADRLGRPASGRSHGRISARAPTGGGVHLRATQHPAATDAPDGRLPGHGAGADGARRVRRHDRRDRVRPAQERRARRRRQNPHLDAGTPWQRGATTAGGSVPGQRVVTGRAPGPRPAAPLAHLRMEGQRRLVRRCGDAAGLRRPRLRADRARARTRRRPPPRARPNNATPHATSP